MQVLLARGHATTDEARQLGWYEQVLELDERNSEALEGKQTIWRRRAERARSERRIEDAVRAYREAGHENLAGDLIEMLHATALARVHDLERTERYVAALAAIQDAGVGPKDWNSDIERITQAMKLLDEYRRAKKALVGGDEETAKQLLSNILAIDPEYKDAAKLLHKTANAASIDRIITTDTDTKTERQPADQRQSMIRKIGWGIVGSLGVWLIFGGWILWGRKPAPDVRAPESIRTTLTSTNADQLSPASSASTTSAASAPSKNCPLGMALIPGGSLLMGSEHRDEPQTYVTIKSFCMDMTEVTVKAYSDCVNDGACGRPYCYWNEATSDPADHPITCVDWHDAVTYCGTRDKRLPDESEWEYAARGGSERRVYPWGDGSPSNQLCWSGASYDLQAKTLHGTCPVGKYPAGDSAQGLHDMAGNVEEWTSNRYCPYHDVDCSDTEYVIRGGSWHDRTPFDVRSAHRSWHSHSGNTTIGFRCARTAQ